MSHSMDVVRDANSIRLSIFLDKIIQRHGAAEVAHELEQLPDFLQSVARKITSTSWVSVQSELSIIDKICRRFDSWDLIEEVGRDAAAAHIYSNQAFLSGSLDEVICQIPSLIAQFATHLYSFVQMDGSNARLHVRHRESTQGHPADLLFVTGVVRGLLSYDRAIRCEITMLECALSADTWPLAAGPETQFDAADNVFFVSILSGADETTTAGRKDQEYVRQVLQRSSELLQDKRELLTAVEYLNMANDQLEKKIRANRQELLMARNIQKGFVPARIPDWKGMQFWVKFFPLTEVSGDFYDYFSLGSRKFGLLVCDVSGHGVPAALISAIAKISFANHRLDSPSEIFGKVNLDILNMIKKEGYLTAFYMIVDDQYRITYSVAAIPSPFLWRAATGVVEKLPGKGTLLGMFSDANRLYDDHSVQMEPGDKLFVFTDGLSEAQNTNGEALDDEGIMAAIKETAGMNVQESSEHIMDAYHQHILGNDPFDDLTLITIMLSERSAEFDSLVKLARARYNAGSLTDATRHLRDAIAIFPRHTQALFLLGRYLAMAGSYKEAVEFLDQYNQLQPYNADSYAISGYCQYSVGNFPLAAENFKRALSMRSEHPTALANLAACYIKMNQRELAQQTIADLVQIRPNHEQLFTLRRDLERME